RQAPAQTHADRRARVIGPAPPSGGAECARRCARLSCVAKASHRDPYSADSSDRKTAMCIRKILVLASALGAATIAGAADKPAPIDVPAIHHPDQETPDWWFRSGAAAANAR